MAMQRSFFISYTGKDRTWAEWLAWMLEDAGYTTCIQAWDFAPGTDWVHEMRTALRDCQRVIAVLSPEYLNSEFASSEWAEAFRKDPLGKARALIPVRIAECDPGPLLNTRVYCDLVGLGQDAAKELLLKAVTISRVKPAEMPPYPGANLGARPRSLPQPSFPGDVPSRDPDTSVSPGTTAISRQPVLSHVQRMVQVSRAPDLLLHTFYGLSARPIQEAPPDFTSIYYLWADAEGSSISANLESPDQARGGLRHFAIRFNNAPGTYSSNVAFRPGGTSGLDNSGNPPGPNNACRRYLSFEARRPQPEPGTLEVIALAYRVIDRFGTHWMLQRGARIDRVTDDRWTTLNIDLADRAWSVFTSDGNYLYARRVPDFSMIVGLVIDFGSDAGEGEPPGDGQGIVHLRNFRLRETSLPEAVQDRIAP